MQDPAQPVFDQLALLVTYKDLVIDALRATLLDWLFAAITSSALHTIGRFWDLWSFIGTTVSFWAVISAVRLATG